MQSDWIKTRQTKYTPYVTVYLLVIVAVLGAANWLANRHNKSIDSTSNKKFSLSDQTVKVVKGLTQDVTITDYDKTSAFTTSRDLLDRYANLSSKLHVVYVDPDKKPQLAKAAGIRSYGQIIVDSGTKKEEAKSLTEEEVTGALIRSMKSGERNVCFVSGGGEHGLDDSGRRLLQREGGAGEEQLQDEDDFSAGRAKPGRRLRRRPRFSPLGTAAPGGAKPEVPPTAPF